MKRELLSTAYCVAIVVSATAAMAQATAGPWKEALSYKLGQSRAALATIEDQIRAAKPGELRTIEDRLLGALKSPQATVDCRDWACRQLRQVGSERAVTALAPFLADKQLSTVARLALQSIRGPAVDAALREALPKLTGNEKAGAIQTIGARRDRQAVPLLAPLAGNADPAVAEMALFALGQIGGPEALKAIRQAKVPQKLARYRSHAMLLCTEQMPAEAAGIYAAVLTESQDAVVKVAALRGLTRIDPAKAGPAIVAALNSTDKKIRLAAVQLGCESGRGELLSQVLPRVASLPADAQATFLTLVGDPAALPSVLAQARSEDEAVCQAAIAAMGRIGDARVVGVLLDVAAIGKGSTQAAARTALQKLRVKQADVVLVRTAEQSTGPTRVEAIRSLAARGATQAVPTLLAIAVVPDRSAHAAALEALGALADAKTLPALVKLVATAQEASDRDAAQSAVVATCRRLDDSESAAGYVLAAMPGAGAEARSALVTILAGMPTNKSLVALRKTLGDPEAEVKAAAIRGLAGWPEPLVLDDLLAIARSADRPAHKVLALRGIARLSALPNKRPAAQTAKLLAECLSLAARPEEKRLVLGALAEVTDAAALDAALGCLADKQVELEAATASVRIAKNLRAANPKAARAAVERVLEVCQAPAARKLATGALLVLDLSANIAPQGTATSPDGLDKDGTAHGDQAAIDNNPATYWDEADGKPLYRLVVTFKRLERVAADSVMGYAQHKYAPKTFEILCDGKSVKQVQNARYDDNLLVVRFEPATCTCVELKITGCYGRSPAVRELGIYRSAEVE